MKNDNSSKTDRTLIRMVSLLKLLEQSPGTLHYLANVLKVSVRTLQRDIDILRNSGFPIVIGEDDEQVRLVSNYCVPPIEFTQNEVLTLLILFEEMGSRIGDPVLSALTTAAIKIASSLSTNFLDVVDRLRHRMTVQPPRTNIETDNDIFQNILNALSTKNAVEIEYRSPTLPEPIQTRLLPYSVLFNRSWYVIGFSAIYQEVRTFKVSRIHRLTQTKIGYQLPTDFSLDKYLRNAWSLIPQGEDTEVIIRFSSKVAHNVAEIRWHKTQQERWLEGNRVELRFIVSGLTEIIWWILGYGAEAEVISPPQLRKMIRNHLDQMIKQYEDNP